MTQQEAQTFEDQPALIQCLPQLNNLREAGKLADLTIKLQNNVKMHAHRVVFASRVPALCDTLCEKPTNGQDFELKWPQISPEVATSFIDYIYTGQLEVHEANVAGLIILSLQLKLPQVEKWAASYMATRLDSENIANKWELAQLLKSDMLRNACLQYIKATFESTVPTDFFIQLPSEAVLSLLRADDLRAESEESVLKAIGQWISPHGKVDKTRLGHAEVMMKEVRWYQVDADFRNRLDDEDGFWNANMECLRLLGRITKWIDIPSSRGDRKCPFNERRRRHLGSSAASECLLNEHHRNPLDAICLLGTSANEKQCLLARYDIDTNKSQKLTVVTAGLDARFAVIDDCVFAIGGFKQDGLYTDVDKFDTRERRWSECAPILGWRESHTAVTVTVGEAVVICVSGGSDRNGQYLGTCLLYSPRENKWYRLPDLKTARKCAASVALPDGRVFVMGGEEQKWDRSGSYYSEKLSSVETCHLKEPADWQGPPKASGAFWKDAAAMLKPRAEQTAVAFRDRIFVAGGKGYSNGVDVFTVPDNQRPLGQWTHLANWDTARTTTALIVCQNRLFSFGPKTESSNSVLEFVPPADPSTPSRGKFDLWTWVDRGTVDDLKDIGGAFLLH